MAAAIVLKLPTTFWQRCGESDTDRLLYAALVLMLLRDAYGCFFLNLTRRPARSIRKPLGYDAAVLRRPRWCPVPLLLRLCAKTTQRLAFAVALGGAAACQPAPQRPWQVENAPCQPVCKNQHKPQNDQ